MAKEPRILFQEGLWTVRTLSDDEITEFRKLRTGIYQTAASIRNVAVVDGCVQILEQKASGLNRIRIPIESKGHLHYVMHRDTRKARMYEKSL